MLAVLNYIDCISLLQHVSSNGVDAQLHTEFKAIHQIANDISETHCGCYRYYWRR